MQQRVTLLRSNLSADVSGAALKLAIAKTAIPALETSTPNDAENEDNPAQPSFEQAGREDRQASPDE